MKPINVRLYFLFLHPISSVHFSLLYREIKKLRVLELLALVFSNMRDWVYSSSR